MIPALIAVTAVSTVASVATSVGTSVAQTDQANETEKNQGKNLVAGGYVAVSNAAGNAPPALKMG